MRPLTEERYFGNLTKEKLKSKHKRSNVMGNGHILVIIIYLILIDSTKTATIKTNAKPEALKEILSEFLRTQIGLGEDESSPNEKDYYTITISLQLEEDVFTVKSDTGNKGLTTGIVMDVLENLGKIEVRNLA